MLERLFKLTLKTTWNSISIFGAICTFAPYAPMKFGTDASMESKQIVYHCYGLVWWDFISCIKIFIKIYKSILLWTPLVECHYMAQTDDCITSFPSCPDKNKYSVSLSLLSFFFATLLSLLKRPSHSLSCAAYVPRVLCLLFPFPLFFQPLNHILFKSYNETLHLL